jgi:co-chaperonin GroES (HSP10)
VNIKFTGNQIAVSGKGSELITRPLSVFGDNILVRIDGKESALFQEADDEAGTLIELGTDSNGQPNGNNRQFQGRVEIDIKGKDGTRIYTTPTEGYVVELPVYKHLMKPLGAFLQVRLLETDKGEKVKGGIIIKEKQPEKTRIAEVLAVGPGHINALTGGRFTPAFSVGDLIYINQHGPVQVLHLEMYEDEPESYIIGENDVYGVYMPYEEALAAGLVRARA